MLALGIIGAFVGVLLIAWSCRRPEFGIKPQPRDYSPAEPKLDANGRLHGKSGQFLPK